MPMQSVKRPKTLIFNRVGVMVAAVLLHGREELPACEKSSDQACDHVHPHSPPLSSGFTVTESVFT